MKLSSSPFFFFHTFSTHPDIKENYYRRVLTYRSCPIHAGRRGRLRKCRGQSKFEPILVYHGFSPGHQIFLYVQKIGGYPSAAEKCDDFFQDWAKSFDRTFRRIFSNIEKCHPNCNFSHRIKPLQLTYATLLF